MAHTTKQNILNRDGLTESPWQRQKPAVAANAATATDYIYDCVIVGGGITGFTAGLLLQQAGKNVAIAEAHNIGFGTTGGTSAHINNFADTSYADAQNAFGEEGTQLFADAITEGAQLIKEFTQKLNINCDYEAKTAYLYAETEDEAKQLDEIHDCMLQVGIPANYTQTAPTPVPFVKAIQIPGQAQFHPIKYLTLLKDAFIAAGGQLFEHTLINELQHADGVHTAISGDNQLKGRYIIYATHTPPGINVFSFRCAPYRSYVLAVKLNNGGYPDALVYDMQEPYHYVRTHVIDGEQLLLIGGNDHKTGHGDPEKAFSDLEQYARKYYDVTSIAYRWSSQYYIPADGFPYVGQIPFMADGVLTATGFNGNGMMLGSISGKILADVVQGIENRYREIFSTARVKPIDGFVEFVKENADVAYHFVADRFGVPEAESLNELQPGTGKLLKLEGEKMAVYRDEAGAIHALNPVCTHAGCIVNFNAAERTWDCPCHGGRYAIDGTVLTGPPTRALPKML